MGRDVSRVSKNMALASKRLRNGEAGNMTLEGHQDSKISSVLTAFALNAELRAKRYWGGTATDGNQYLLETCEACGGTGKSMGE